MRVEERGKIEDWIEAIVDAEKATHLAFFGENVASGFDYERLKETLKRCGKDKIKEWEGLGLKVAFLPPVEMKESVNFPGWKVKPEEWFYKRVAEGEIDKTALWLGDLENGGSVVLFDTRCKPNYNEGKQMWENDNLLGHIIENLRSEGEIARYNYGHQSSRFGVSAIEGEDCVYPALAESLGVNPKATMPESVVQGNYLSQAYQDLPRFKDGQTDTWVWFKDFFVGGRHCLGGGVSDYGGRADVYCYLASGHWCYVSCLPLVVLSP